MSGTEQPGRYMRSNSAHPFGTSRCDNDMC
jgi:hypothetical protein